jgi:RNA polymerase sigma factor (sigma-70 family)
MPVEPAVRALGRLCQRPSADCPDARLLERFVADRDEEAFAALVERHGPMVLAVCRRRVGNTPDADDAFQATFLALARQAGSLRRPGSVAAWLHGVARRTAGRVRPAASEDLPEVQSPAAGPPDEASWGEVRRALDEELGRLGDRLRTPLVLCYLEGQTRDAAARLLGMPLRTLKRRLEQGRRLLHVRLTRRGFGAAGLAVAALGPDGLRAAVPAALARQAVTNSHGGPVPAALAALAG